MNQKNTAFNRKQKSAAGYVAVREDGMYLARWGTHWHITADSSEAVRMEQNKALDVILHQISEIERECWWVCPVAYLPENPASCCFVILHTSGMLLTRDKKGMWGATNEVLFASHMDIQEANEVLEARAARAEAEQWRVVGLSDYLHPDSVSQREVNELVIRICGDLCELNNLYELAVTYELCCKARLADRKMRENLHPGSYTKKEDTAAQAEALKSRSDVVKQLEKLLALPAGEIRAYIKSLPAREHHAETKKENM